MGETQECVYQQHPDIIGTNTDLNRLSHVNLNHFRKKNR